MYFISVVQHPKSGLGHLIAEVYRSHHTRYYSSGRRCHHLHKTHKKQRSIFSGRFEPAIQEIRRLQTYAFDCMATGIGQILF